MAGYGVAGGGRPPLSRSVVVSGASGRELGSTWSVGPAHAWTHGHVRVGGGPFWVVDLAALSSGSARVTRVDESGCFDLSVPLGPARRMVCLEGGPVPVLGLVGGLGAVGSGSASGARAVG
jgi:hypothetical protein